MQETRHKARESGFFFAQANPNGSLDMAKTDLQIESLALDSVTPAAHNSRTHSKAQIAQVAASIREFGFVNPVLVDEKGELIAGHARVQAAKIAGLAKVPAIRLGYLSEPQKRALLIADNQLASNAGWDMDVLRSEIEALQAVEFDTALLGFSEEETAAIFAAPLAEGLADPDAAVNPLDGPAVTQPGDLWECGAHRVLCGDSTSPEDVKRLLGSDRPHLMVTDPPYGVDYDPEWRAQAGINKNRGKMGAVTSDGQADWSEAWALFPGDAAYVWHAGRHASEVQASLESAGLDIRSQVIWAKDRMALSRGHYHWQHEPCWYAVRKNRKGHWVGGRSQTTVWNIPARDDSGHGHSTQKPVECMRRPMENNSVPGDAVYDPFLGSGTSMIAAEQTGRRCLGLEIAPAYST